MNMLIDAIKHIFVDVFILFMLTDHFGGRKKTMLDISVQDERIRCLRLSKEDVLLPDNIPGKMIES